MNVKIGTEAVQFPEKEYINGMFVAVREERCLIFVQALQIRAAWKFIDTVHKILT